MDNLRRPSPSIGSQESGVRRARRSERRCDGLWSKTSLHSGHYGNWAPNPAMTLVRLLATMKDDNGRVTIAGWYDGVEPLGEAEKRAIAEAPAYDDELRAQLGLAKTEGNVRLLMELINEASLN